MMKNNKMKLTLQVMAQLSLIWILKTSFNFFAMKLIALNNDGWNDGEHMHIAFVATSNIFHIAKCKYSFLKLFCQIVELSTKQNITIHLQPNKCTINSSWKKPKAMFFFNFDFQKLIVWMSFGLLSLAINSPNWLSISPHIPITTKTMVVVTKDWSMQWEKLRIVFFGRKCNFTQGSNVGMVITFVVVESSIVQSKSPLSWSILAFT